MFAQLIDTCYNIYQALRNFALVVVEKMNTKIADILDDTGVIGWIGQLVIPDNLLRQPIYVVIFGVGIGYVLLLSAKKLL